MQKASSIQVRLRRVILIPTAAVLLLATATFLIYEFVSFRRAHRDSIYSVAEVVAQNCTATLSFDSPEEAVRVLGTFSAESTVLRALLFDEKGAVFAQYHTQPGGSQQTSPGPDRVRYEGDKLVVVLPVQEERRMGTLYLEAGLGPLYERMSVITLLSVLVLSSSFGLAYFLSNWLQRRVTEPLLELAETASQVSRTRDFSLRAPKRTEDEIGTLTTAFNDMLAEIGRRSQALRQSTERLQLALEASVTGTWDWDLDKNVIVWDDHVQALFGLSPGEFQGTPEDFIRRVHPDDQPGLERIVRRAVEKRKELYAEYRVIWPDGSIHSMVSRGRALTEGDSRPTRMTGVTIDVTESKRAEQALRESEERFRLMAESAPVFIWTMDVSKRIDYINREWREFTGRALEDELGFGWTQAIHPEDRENAIRKFNEAFDRRSEFEIEYRLRRKDGAYRTILDHGVPRFAADGAFRGYIGSCLDITDIRQAQNELERRVESRTAELAETNRELEAFTYSVSHDLRAPLRHINSYAQVLEEDFAAELPKEAREYLGRIRAGAQNMGMLVDDLLNLAKIGRQDLAMSPWPLNFIVDEAVREVTSDIGGRQIEWKIADLGSAECDAGLMKQVFVNLISNAVKYTRPRARAVIEIGSNISENGQPIYFVRDNGVGFDMKYAGKLFGVFQRLHRAEDFEGTGVGLALVERIIRRHGGRVWAEAAPDKGAAFFFTLGRSAKEGAPAV